MGKRVIALVVAAIVSLASCESDNFYEVTKTIEAPNRIEINKPFVFNAGLVNNTTKLIRLTFDKQITKSLYFDPRWYCGEKLVLDKTPNPINQIHDYYTVHLQPKDSISFRFSARLISFSNNDSLKFIVDGYEKDFRLINLHCSDFKMRLQAMWVPGDGSFFDSLEGLDFRKDIEIQ
jgi:hypothetical protein